MYIFVVFRKQIENFAGVFLKQDRPKQLEKELEIFKVTKGKLVLNQKTDWKLT